MLIEWTLCRARFRRVVLRPIFSFRFGFPDVTDQFSTNSSSSSSFSMFTSSSPFPPEEKVRSGFLLLSNGFEYSAFLVPPLLQISSALRKLLSRSRNDFSCQNRAEFFFFFFFFVQTTTHVGDELKPYQLRAVAVTLRDVFYRLHFCLFEENLLCCCCCCCCCLYMCFFDDDSKVYEERNIGAEREKKGENLLYRGTCTGYIFITPIF